MADLDDFFAKKDRKKNKGKKFSTTDDIAKRLEESGRKAEKAKKEKLNLQSQCQGPDGEDLPNQGHEEDDEWKDFEEEKKDYSGLRIGNLQINESEGEGGSIDNEEHDGMEENETGELVPRRKVHSGPWKMVTTTTTTAAQVQEPVPEPVPEKRVETTGSTMYLPPHLRNQPKENHSSPRSKSKLAPDINSEEFFPTLSSSKGPDTASGKGRRRRDEGTFEAVRNSKSHSNRYLDSSNRAVVSTGPKLNLGNKYGALSQDHDQDQS